MGIWRSAIATGAVYRTTVRTGLEGAMQRRAGSRGEDRVPHPPALLRPGLRRLGRGAMC